ncbi:DUF559 domain-containing protein [Microbacterium oleivorans]|uniref:DUF559 domain-containing protein n=1 Tax=Microbacterium oleivorans TaxID=273677 RepID=UPI001CB9897F|nr:DUF559 domain-containing protein [Microbacterium oleivorans]
MRRQQPVLAVDDLARAVYERRRTRHIGSLRRALTRARARTDSVAETLLRLDAADAGLPEFAVNEAIRDAHGRFLAYGDLVHAPTRVLLEYDGQEHRLDDRQYARDVERLDALAAAGWRVIRVNRSHRGPDRRRVLERVHSGRRLDAVQRMPGVRRGRCGGCRGPRRRSGRSRGGANGRARRRRG